MWRRFGPVIGLFLLAPFFGEFVLGNLTLSELPLGIILAPMYGCGALLVRELGRRYGGGWPTMALLAVAYALIEEGPVDQLLWNDSYAGHDYISGPSYLPALGTSVAAVQVVIALHAVWSICVPIAIAEALTRTRRTTPWLGRPGLTIVALLWLAGTVFVFYGNYAEERFMATPAQFATAAVVIGALVVTAFVIRKRRLRPVSGRAPAPWLVGGFGLVATSAYWAPNNLVTAESYAWFDVAVWCAVVVIGVLVVSRWSRRDGWDHRHRYALGAGAALTYVWMSFPVRPEAGGSVTVDLVSNAVIGTLAVLILWLAWRRVHSGPSSKSMVNGCQSAR